MLIGIACRSLEKGSLQPWLQLVEFVVGEHIHVVQVKQNPTTQTKPTFILVACTKAGASIY